MSSPISPTPGAPGKIALPGLSKTPLARGTDNLEDCGPSPDFVKEPPREEPEEKRSVERKPGGDKPQPRRPAVPHKPSRIPSTGNRATVMDVAQVWSEHEKQSSQYESSPRSTSPNSPFESRSTHPIGAQTRLDHQNEQEREREPPEQVEPPGVVVKAPVAGRGAHIPVPAPSAVETPLESEKERGVSLKLPDLLTPVEKSTSSWEKYSELIMPALEEEWTPAPSPMPTLNKLPEVHLGTKEEPVAAATSAIKRSQKSQVDYLPFDLLSTTLEPERKIVKVSPADLINFGRKSGSRSFLCLFPFEDFPNYAIPTIDVRPLLKPTPKPALSDPDVTIVSVDVLSIVGFTSSAIISDTSTFYETEILAIIQRAKVKSKGLVDTKVWGWIGRDAQLGPKEEKMLGGLAKRYGTQLVGALTFYFPQHCLNFYYRLPPSSTTSQSTW